MRDAFLGRKGDQHFEIRFHALARRGIGRDSTAIEEPLHAARSIACKREAGQSGGSVRDNVQKAGAQGQPARRMETARASRGNVEIKPDLNSDFLRSY